MAHLSNSTPPMYMPSAGSRRNSSPLGARLSSSPLPGSSFFDSKSSPSIPSSVPKTFTTQPSMGSLRPPSLQRSKSTNTSPRPQTPASSANPPPSSAPDSRPTLARTPSIPHRFNTVSPGTAHERPPLPTRSSTLPHVRTSPVSYTTENLEDESTRRRIREEMLQWVKSEVESIDKETDAAAKRNLDSARRGMRRRGSTLVEPPTPDRMAEFSNSFPHVRSRTQARRGSVDSGVAGAWKPVDAPRKAKDWEKWAENKVQSRRRLDEAWKEEENTVKETERLIQETQTHDKLRREREARKQWESKAFLEKERQRVAREEHERQSERQRVVREEHERQSEQKRRERFEDKRRELEDTLIAEAIRQHQLEREVRRIEKEARRLEEELRQRERKLQQEEAASRAKAQQERPSGNSTPRPKASPGNTWLPSDVGLESDSDYFGAAWERFAEAIKGAGKNHKAKYQSPTAAFKEAWESYETRWFQLSRCAPHPGSNMTKTTPPRFGFADIPWPVLHQPTKAGDVASLMTEAAIAAFILSPLHSKSGSPTSTPMVDTKTRKARLREALLRWHPDKMARILVSVTAEDERANVKEGAEAVARHLNALLARES